jgi:dCMP deaminase
MARVTIDELMLRVAALMSLRGTCNRAAIGTVITMDTRIISSGYVGSPPGTPHCHDVGCLIDPQTGGCIRTQHAEANAITFAARNGVALYGATLYTTVSPCLSCAKIIISAGIKRVVYAEEYRILDGIILLRDTGVIVTNMRR